jgi:hypothetical protein
MTNAMTCQQFEELIPRLLDGDVEMSADMRAHASACTRCQSLLADLKTIQAGAATLPALEPQRDLWSGIAARIAAPVVSLTGEHRSRSERRQISWRAAAIAAAILVAVTTMITYRVAQRAQPAPTLISGLPGETMPVALAPVRVPDRPSTATTVANTPPRVTRSPAPSPARVVLASNTTAKVEYDREIMKLRAIVDSGRTRLDPATVALLERNLRVIDSAIVQCRDALAKDPASSFLIESLNNAYQTKVKLLRIAAAASTE